MGRCTSSEHERCARRDAASGYAAIYRCYSIDDGHEDYDGRSYYFSTPKIERLKHFYGAQIERLSAEGRFSAMLGRFRLRDAGIRLRQAYALQGDAISGYISLVMGRQYY